MLVVVVLLPLCLVMDNGEAVNIPGGGSDSSGGIGGSG
jgi:hypothetical protein